VPDPDEPSGKPAWAPMVLPYLYVLQTPSNWTGLDPTPRAFVWRYGRKSSHPV